MRSSVLSLSSARTALSATPPVERSVAPALPTRLRPADLLRLTDEGAEDVLAGRYDHLLPAGGIWPQDERWATRLLSDDEVDVWLISWTPGKSTELHDHAGSLGALTVLSGALSEYRWNGTELRCRTLAAGDQASFPIGWVHDVMRAPGVVESAGPPDPTLSVHAYSPPLTAMSYYEVTGHGTLRRTRTVLTDQPEGDM
ncbi:cysteine dioxygenase family protein [Nocardia implantans]|uniref:Cysteine dioxygenase family protein n=1 Tax=Nocardia implantans TaxID=3108168 RepID=A0ABU6B313_9NOCA|nr:MULTISPECIES: cysteine dioxygenase family protein [unclassified Nocardia]MBF6190339.1 cysteine dioxygenase family protein [Nocardia beijingensis]MEA3531867.1 cysteine dioxygenase family protein [Nocardia sp. CDC192]MEB3514031.1 cysteine dioxygenase family protein [Nocardia sp. CDC186]